MSTACTFLCHVCTIFFYKYLTEKFKAEGETCPICCVWVVKRAKYVVHLQLAFLATSFLSSSHLCMLMYFIEKPGRKEMLLPAEVTPLCPHSSFYSQPYLRKKTFSADLLWGNVLMLEAAWAATFVWRFWPWHAQEAGVKSAFEDAPFVCLLCGLHWIFSFDYIFQSFTSWKDFWYRVKIKWMLHEVCSVSNWHTNRVDQRD